MSLAKKGYEPIEQALNDDQILRYAQDLIRINSVNPNLGEGEGERRVADYLVTTAQDAGLQVEAQQITAGRPNVLVTYPGQNKDIGLLFLAHTDTVPFLGMPDPLSAELVDGHIWGRGGVDMKGGLAAAMQALMVLARTKAKLERSVAVAAVIDEESEHRGAYVFAQSDLKARACIVPEPSNLQLILGCKGTAPIWIRLAGRLAHGSSPWLGINAIEKSAKVILALSRLEPREMEMSELGIVVRGTVNVGMIRGGTAYNNVPDECSIYLDRRTVPGETQDRCLAEIQEVITHLASQDPDLTAELSISRPDWHWEPIRSRGLNPAHTGGESPVVKIIHQAYMKVVGSEPEMGFSNGYMDMDFMVNDLGIPTVNIGPGDVALAHHAEERVPVNQLLLATRIYLLAAIELAGLLG